MKLLLVLLSFAAASSVSFATSVTVVGEEFLLASSGENQAEVIREFLPKGQKLESWTRLVSIRRIPKQKSPKDYIAALAQTYHASYPHMQFSVGGKKEEWFIDFIAYPREPVALTYVEWNFFVARKDPKQGVVASQYAIRHYSERSLDDAFQHFDVRALRSRLLEKLKKERFEIQEPNQSLEPTPMAVTPPAAQEPRQP